MGSVVRFRRTCDGILSSKGDRFLRNLHGPPQIGQRETVPGKLCSRLATVAAKSAGLAPDNRRLFF
jgi:hypothetical protein